LNTIIKRAVISIVIFAVIYFGADLIMAVPTYDATVDAIQFLAAVLGAGCFWIGSNK